MAELINGGHKVSTSNPTEIVTLRARGYTDYVAPKPKTKTVKTEPKDVTEAPEELTKN